MKYPRKSPYLIYKKTEHNDYRIENYLSYDVYRITNKTAAFLKCLDGRHNPYELLPDCSRSDVQKILREFKAYHLLAPKKNLIVFGVGSFMYPLIYCYPGKWKKLVAIICNFLLMALFFPTFILGLCLGKSSIIHIYAQSKIELFVAVLIGAIIGITMHELSHACAGLAYGAHIFEIGVGTKFFIPMGYVLMDPSNVKSRLKRVQIEAAGIEMNLFLCGALMFLKPATFINPFVLKACILVNLSMGILNALPLNGLDGMRILSTLFKKENLLEHAKGIIIDRNKQIRKTSRRAIAIAEIAASYFLVGFQLVLPMLVIFEGYNLVRLIFL